MAKSLAELDVQVSGDVQLRLKKSKQFLSGGSETIDLGGKSPISLWVCRLMIWLGLISLIGILGLTFYIWMWDSSPLTSETEVRVTSIDKKSQGGEVSFEYKVNGTDYKTTQYANSLRNEWKGEPGKGTAVYLNFMPGSSKLKPTVERMDWGMLFMGPIMPLGFLIGGVLGLRSTQRLARIEDNATHLLNGVVSNHFKTKGMVVVQYKAQSPSGSEIFGSVDVGKLESVLPSLQVGAAVVVVYANDKEHTLL